VFDDAVEALRLVCRHLFQTKSAQTPRAQFAGYGVDMVREPLSEWLTPLAEMPDYSILVSSLTVACKEVMQTVLIVRYLINSVRPDHAAII